ncbi:MAG: hypothetical protein HY711_02775, partial [Candidatus Melainabacteria bacterium]|nr:hypothetical protein [Candidatus Melainabacteria bacterium]
PAALSAKRVVISSATISLQEQYIHKDIPFLQSILPFEVQAAIMKGRGNYLGLRRFDEHLLDNELDDRLVDWVHNTSCGDLSELNFVPPANVWLDINSDTDDCLRNKCPHLADCFYFEARKKAEKADILVVNHALLLADAASFGNILPAYDLLVVDEAQHLPDVARDAFSVSISNRGLRMLAGRATNKVQAPAQLVQDIEIEGSRFFDTLFNRYPTAKIRVREPFDNVGDFRAALTNLKKWLEVQEFEHILDVDLAREKAKLKAKAVLTTVENYIQCLDLLESPDGNWVTWIEKVDIPGGKCEVTACPLDVAPLLKSFLFDKTGLESLVFMSATLATGGEDPFAYFKRTIGADEAVIQSKVDSPFNYKHQAVLYLPDVLPEPNNPEFVPYATREIERILKICNGRAFVLFTSYSAMNRAFEELAERLSFECRRQGDMPRRALIEWFVSTPSAVLFGTSSFWEGVSVEGDRLSCVIIDRIPFQVPDDPVYEAQCEALKESGEGDWFADLALPHAIMRLKQGVGRLIRTRSDTGLVAILDPRLTRKAYGRKILECLPPMPIIRSLEGVESLEDMLDHCRW